MTPSDADVRDAIALGTQSADGQALQYAYLTKAQRVDATYVTVATPLYVIASHAREQARQYREVDPEFIACARDLRAVHLSVAEQFMSSATYRSYQFQRQLILLRDGKRVEPLLSVRACGGGNPFLNGISKQAQEMIARAMKNAAQYTMAYYASMPEDQKKRLVDGYRAMGWSDTQIAATGLTVPNSQDTSGAGRVVAAQMVPLSDGDAVFSAEEMNKPGTYEVVFRTPPDNQLFYRGDDEIRVPISFEQFR